jgi:hypothetical protein
VDRQVNDRSNLRRAADRSREPAERLAAFGNYDAADSQAKRSNPVRYEVDSVKQEAFALE